MKALLVNGSPRPRGCTYTALTELKKTLEAEGIEVELLHVGNKDIRGCIACRKCAQTGKCVFDDVVNEVAPSWQKRMLSSSAARCTLPPLQAEPFPLWIGCFSARSVSTRP